jgi:hypothetical protein
MPWENYREEKSSILDFGGFIFAQVFKASDPFKVFGYIFF